MSRSRRLAVLLTLVGAGLVLLAATRQWADVRLTTVPGLSELTVSGKRAAPAAVPVALAAAAAAIVLAISGRVVRLVIGAGLTLAGIVLALTWINLTRDATGPLTSALHDSLGLVSSRDDAAAFAGFFNAASIRITLWPWVATLGAVLIAAAGLITLVKGWAWATAGRRFERPISNTEAWPGSGPPPAESVPAVLPDLGLAVTWDALSRGEDPTSRPQDPT